MTSYNLNSILNIDIFNSLSSGPITGYVIQTVKTLNHWSLYQITFCFLKKNPFLNIVNSDYGPENLILHTTDSVPILCHLILYQHYLL